jgi:Uma2 family endonuclease
METPIHVLVMVALISALRHYFRQRSDIYVIGNIFLYYEEGHPESRRSPDLMIVKGVDAAKYRRSFKTWEERAVPSFVLEITSRETAEEDQGPKRELYERLGVREYFLFDPLHDYLERPLIAYRLIGDQYEPLPAADDGGVLSAELGLRLVPEGENLALIEFRTGERLPYLPELSQTLQETQEKASQTEQRARQVENELREERQRVQQMAEELARLRALLPPVASAAGSPQE